MVRQLGIMILVFYVLSNIGAGPIDKQQVPSFNNWLLLEGKVKEQTEEQTEGQQRLACLPDKCPNCNAFKNHV